MIDDLRFTVYVLSNRDLIYNLAAETSALRFLIDDLRFTIYDLAAETSTLRFLMRDKRFFLFEIDEQN